MWPPLFEPTRKPIDLTGVPDHIAAHYKDALAALDDDRLYPYAGILARASVEAILEERGYTGKVLANMMDQMLQDGKLTQEPAGR